MSTHKRKKILLIASTIFTALLLLFLVNGKRVLDDDMAGSIRIGDWVWYHHTPPYPGAAVVLADPLNPNQFIIRRAITKASEEYNYDRNGTIRIGRKRIRQKDMGREGEWRVIEETLWGPKDAKTLSWLIMRKLTPISWQLPEPITIPENHWMLMADRRDEAIDSRWWGPIHEKHIKGVVWLRAGSSDAWRSWVELYSAP